MKKFLQILASMLISVALIYAFVMLMVYFQYNHTDAKNEKSQENSLAYFHGDFEKFLQKSLMEKDLSDDELFSANGGDFFPIVLLAEKYDHNIRVTNYADLKTFLQNSENISGIRFGDNFESKNAYSNEDFMKIISLFTEYGKLSENFVIVGKLQVELLQANEIFDKILAIPVKNLQIFTYADGQFHFSREHIEKMKQSRISLFDIASYSPCLFDGENVKNGIIYVNKIPKIFCYLQKDISLPVLFSYDENNRKQINPDYLAEIYKKTSTENQNLTIDDKVFSFESFKTMNFDAVKNISISLSEGHSREYLIAVLDRLSREDFEHIHIQISFASLDYETLEMLTFLHTKKLSLDVFEAYNWRIPKFVIPEDFVKNFREKFEFFGIVTSTGMGGISEIFFEKNGQEVQNIDGKMISTTALWLYGNYESEEEKAFLEKFYIKKSQN